MANHDLVTVNIRFVVANKLKKYVEVNGKDKDYFITSTLEVLDKFPEDMGDILVLYRYDSSNDEYVEVDINKFIDIYIMDKLETVVKLSNVIEGFIMFNDITEKLDIIPIKYLCITASLDICVIIDNHVFNITPHPENDDIRYYLIDNDSICKLPVGLDVISSVHAYNNNRVQMEAFDDAIFAVAKLSSINNKPDARGFTYGSMFASGRR